MMIKDSSLLQGEPFWIGPGLLVKHVGSIWYMSATMIGGAQFIIDAWPI